MPERKGLISFLCFLFLLVGGWLFGIGCEKSSAPAPESTPSQPQTSQPEAMPSGKDSPDKSVPVDRKAELQKPEERELGLPFYPGSEDTKESGRTAEGGYLSVRTTRDSVEQVVRFYKSRLPHIDNEVVLPNSVTILAEHDGRKVFLLVTREGEVTRITLSVSLKG
jgi:hypothetical protein